MPLHLGPSGKTAVEPGGKVKKKFKTKKAAKEFVAVVNIATAKRKLG